VGLKKIRNKEKYKFKLGKEPIDGIYYINFNKLSEKQKKMLHELYIEYTTEGLKSKEALEKAFQIVTSFKL